MSRKRFYAHYNAATFFYMQTDAVFQIHILLFNLTRCFLSSEAMPTLLPGACNI